ncbi:MAG TPA: LAGLIDADG family homing endonuclease, partial [Ktedonobacterales bacterium]
MDLVKRLEEYRDRERELTWEGTFAQYFEIATKQPSIAQLSHERIYNMIMAAGTETSRSGDPRYKFFSQEIFGLEKPLQQIAEYFHSAAQRLEVRKRILLLMGPVGGGKSTIVYLLKRGLEQYTRAQEGAIYAIRDCPMHEEALHLIPHELREDVEREFGLYVEGDLCPHCRWMIEDKYGGKIEEVPVKRIAFSEKNRIGIGTFTPSDPKSQDVAELVGGIDLSTIGEVGVESDPRAYRFDGELNIANRGLMEFIEMLKCVNYESILFTNNGIRQIGSFAQPDHPAGESRPVEVQLASATGVETAAHLYHAGVQPTKRVTTRRGYAFEGTHEHRIQVVNSEGVQVWRRLDELQVSDWAVMQQGQNLWGQDVEITWKVDRPKHALSIKVPERMTPGLARWLGYLVAEGSTKAGLIDFTNSEEELRTDYCQLTEELFGVRPRLLSQRVLLNNVALVDLLTYLGFKTGAYNKEVPWSVLQSSRECVLEFLSGYFAGDGSVNLGGRLFWITASERLAEQLQIVLLNLGVVSRRVKTQHRSSKNSPYQDYWTVTASGADADLLAAQMRLLPVRKQFIYEKRRAEQPRAGRADVIPNTSQYWAAISDDLQRVVKARAMLTVGGPGYRAREGAWQVLGSDYLNLHALRTGTNTCTREMATKMLTKLEGWVEPPTGLSALLNPAQFYDEVVSIEESEADCWDFNVPGSNTFIANGFVNHNCDEKFLYVLLTLSQEQNIKTGRFSMIYADEVVVSHTNEAEFQAFIGNRKSEALQDRIILIKVPYNLRVSDEVKIYEKLLRQSALQNVHIAPNTLRIASTFAVLTRLEPSKKGGMSLMKKLKLYDGEDLEDFKQKDIKELQDEAQREGMDGISPRYVINRLSSALVRENATCINPIDALRSLRDGLDQHTGITREERERYLNFISEARKEFDQLAQKEVQRAFVYSYEESARTLLNNYLDNVEAYCNKTKVRDPITDEDMEPDEQLMRSIEEQIGITENAKKTFREEILIRISSLARRGQTFDYTSHERLKEAIEKKLFADLRDVVK